MNREKLVGAVCHLTMLTQKGIIKWSECIGNNDTRNMFNIKLKNGNLLILTGSRNGYIELKIINSSGIKLYEFPYTNAMGDLFTCVMSIKSSGLCVDYVLDGILDGSIFKEE